MSEAIPETESETAQLPEELPPVQPPSAGFIVQLFVVPGLIVVAIVAVWLLFGKLASTDQDWRSQVVELQHPNPHRRWRAALGLAQMLNADQGEAGSRLSDNQELAQALSDELIAEIQRGGQSNKDEDTALYLARALGLFDVPEITLPALEKAAGKENSLELRKNAITSLALMTDRLATAGQREPQEKIAQVVSDASRDGEPLIRQLCAFTLGLFPQPQARERLLVLLEDSDPNTRINAAIGLARQGDARGAAVFEDALRQATTSTASSNEEKMEQFLVLKNALAGIDRVAGSLSVSQRTSLIGLIEPIARKFPDGKIQVTAQGTLTALQGAGNGSDR
ncbi:MAG: HEAT repeat domain-containing protein [Planctomycetales bacterium]